MKAISIAIDESDAKELNKIAANKDTCRKHLIAKVLHEYVKTEKI